MAAIDQTERIKSNYPLHDGKPDNHITGLEKLGVRRYSAGGRIFGMVMMKKAAPLELGSRTERRRVADFHPQKNSLEPL